LAGEFPGSSDLVLRAATVERSLGRTEQAVALARDLIQVNPRDREALARAGDTLADRDLFTRARPYWNRMPQTEPGKPDGYLEAATVFWDYYKYDDALRLIGEARARFHQPDLYAYEAGAIFEGKRDYAAAVKEYGKGSEEGQARLVALAQTSAHRAAVDAGTARAPLRVRVAILEAEKRLDDLQALLQSRAASSTSAADLAFIQETAGRDGFAAVEQLALERQVAVNRDPLERIRLRLALMRFEEARSNVDGARRTIEALYHDNPAILGVVRATTDFYWRHKLAGQAIATLTQAAAISNAGYRNQFTYEAARKATEAREFAQARQLLGPLLAAQPFDSQYLAANADTYAQAGDDRGLRDFYRAAIESMKQAPLAVEERNERTAGLRRGLIPALARLGQPWDAVDQYIQLVNRYPEDQGLIREAARFAARNLLAPRLIAYYTKACSDSPKDYRWPMVLGRMQTHFEDFDAAIAAYTAATVARPDRMDLYLNRAALEERLLRFAEAEQTYRKVWELSYRNAAWQEKIAELLARQGKADDAVATLRKGYLEDRPERADTLLQMAGKLESWGLVKQAGEFATHAAQYGLEHENTAVYARVLTRLRRHEEVLSRLSGDEGALMAMAQAVNQYYTPEEKAAFEIALEKQAGMSPDPRWNSVAHAAGIYGLEARWMVTQIARAPYFAQELYQLQSQRMRYQELGRQLEEAGDRNFLSQAAGAYATIGDAEGLNRVMARMPEGQRQYAQREWQTIARDNPWKLLPFAAHRNDAVDLAIESGDVKLALSAVAERGKSLPPVWTKAYTALTSLYYWSSAPDATGVFRNLLGAATIGERLGKRVDRGQQLAGPVWFYYGARFGEYLALKGQPQADDYLAAALEADPANAASYCDLADWYVERGDARRAFAEYEHTLELDPSRGAPHDRIALLLWDQGRRDEAIAQWKSALAAFEAQQGRPNLQEDFWTNAPAAIQHIGERKLVAELGADVDSLLRAYVARHSGYRAGELIANAVKYRLIDFSRQPLEVLEQSDEKSLEIPERIAILRRMIYLTRNNQWQQRSWKSQLAGLLLDAGDLAGAQAELAGLKADTNAPRYEWVDLELRIAAESGGLDAILDRFPLRELENAARDFEARHEETVADRILEFVYSRELDQGDFSASNFLGLAQIRLKKGDTAEALQLLRRMQLVSDEPFENLMPAADLLRRFELAAEAGEFLKARVAAVPWDAQARVQLGQGLAALVSDSDAPYRVRVEAAKTGAKGGAGELALMARGNITAAEAGQPYYYDARLAAAESITDARTRVRLLMDAVAIRPDEREPMLPLFRAAYEAGQFEVAHQAAWREHAAPGLATARQMADVYERFDEEYAAEARLREAKEGQPAAVQQQLEREIADLDQRAKRRVQNAARRPEVTAGLEQGRVVRPRIEK
jgi:Flp pilus assembly protein TadD